MYLCIFAFIVSLVVVFLIPFFTCFVVWGVIHGVVVVSIGGTIYLWITWKEMSDFEINNNQVPQKFKYTYFSYALIATTFTITILLFIFKMRCHIAFVIQLHKESGKAISSMPILLLQPVGTFIFMCLSLNIWVYFGLIIEGSGYKQFEPLSRTIYYHKDDLMEFSKIYNIFVLIWIIQFIIGCQDMIIARCVSTWFFTRNKDDVTDPISCSIKYLLKHHLGSVTIRQCFANYLQNYTVYGDEFYASKDKAYNVIARNATRLAATSHISYFILCIGKVLVVISTMVFDTIFMCFCEDGKLNDGFTEQYYMSKELMIFVESSQNKLRVGDEAKN
eukprot:XP_016662875.1 PREDICTED: choline transporter-like protein 1 [Acyrthosiphon pisum]